MNNKEFSQKILLFLQSIHGNHIEFYARGTKGIYFRALTPNGHLMFSILYYYETGFFIEKNNEYKSDYLNDLYRKYKIEQLLNDSEV